MIYIARLLGMLGAVATAAGVCCVAGLLYFQHHLPDDINAWFDTVLIATVISGAVLCLGQFLGNDLFGVSDTLGRKFDKDVHGMTRGSEFSRRMRGIQVTQFIMYYLRGPR